MDTSYQETDAFEAARRLRRKFICANNSPDRIDCIRIFSGVEFSSGLDFPTPPCRIHVLHCEFFQIYVLRYNCSSH